MEYNFKKVHTGKDLAISFILIIAGVGFFFLNKGLGIFFAICGILCLLFFKMGCKLNGQGDLLVKKSLDLCKDCKSSLMDYLNGKDITPIVKDGCEGGTVRLDVYFNKETGVAYAQLYDFCNLTYEPLTDIVELHSPKSDKLIFQI